MAVMLQGSTTTTKPADDLRPWRKRHPVLSRAILYTLGIGLAVLLVVLWSERQDDDRATELAAIQQQIDGLGLVLATDPTGDQLLAILDERFAGDDLPVLARERSLRWRAMAWRRKAETAETDAARDAAHRKADAAHADAAALDLAAEERFALGLERTEALLVRQDLDGARAALPALERAPGVTAGLMRQFVQAQLLRLEGRTGDACDLLRATLQGVQGPLPREPDAYIGGREWTTVQVAVELASFVTSQGGEPSDVALWAHLRALAPEAYDVQRAAASGLAALGAEQQALAAWRSARRLDGRLAAIECGRDETLGRLDAALRSP